MIPRTLFQVLAALTLALAGVRPACGQSAATPAGSLPNILGLSQPVSGDSQILFRGKSGPFRLQSRTSLATNAIWFDVIGAKITPLQNDLYLATFPLGREDAAYYRVVSENETIAELKGWTVQVQVSAPANKFFYLAGEKIVVTVSILDSFALGIGRNELSTLALYMHGPQEPSLTVTPLKLLNATGDRTKNPHHYINLKTNPDVQVNGNVLTYTLQPVTDELPGTYTISVRAVLGTDTLQQIMKATDVQIGTSAVDAPVVSRANCAKCHEGPASGKMYMHHIDPSGTSLGSWSLDYEPVRSCSPCHNNDGYAAYNSTNAPGGKVPDPVVRRVHGVHMGALLASNFNTNQATGDFRDYTHGNFPAGIKNCTACHSDFRWLTQPSRLACGTCHDNIWFGPKTEVPAGMVKHRGGAFTDDLSCNACHPPEVVEEDHEVPGPPFQLKVAAELSTPANGRFFVAGETPAITIKITDLAGQTVSPTNIFEPLVSGVYASNEWRRANLYVSGPRAKTVPVLTTSAAQADPTKSTLNNELRILRGTNAAKADPRITRTADAIVYQLAAISNLAAGTYSVFVDLTGPTDPKAAPGGWTLVNFQVGTTNNEPMVAGNCRDCHRNTRIHTTSRYATFEPDICKSCHDYQHQMTGKTNWSNSQFGFGVSPLSRRVHGIHFGNYLAKPGEVSSQDFSHVIFSMDVRNCTKCHSQSSSWNEQPSRLACLACHDSDQAQAHGRLMTFDPTPQDPWNGDELESCGVCHGADGEYSARKAHSIANPYVPPYPRAAR